MRFTDPDDPNRTVGGPLTGAGDGHFLPPGHDLKVGLLYPNRFERIVRVVMQIAFTVACLLAAVLMVLLLGAISSVADRLNAPDPAPAVTVCPFGDLECGG